MDLQLKGTAALITGAARGIGKEIAAVFLEEGAAVTLLDIDEQELQKTVQSFSAQYGAQRAVGRVCDITDERAATHACDETAERCGGIDYLINNAGISEPAALEETELSSWERVIRVNLTAPFIMSKAVFRHMRAKSHGVIVNIGSFAGKRGTLFGNNASYSVSKAGIIGLTKALVPEAAAIGVRVVAVCPGIVETDMVKNHPPETRKKLADLIPLGALATPRQIADVVVFLCSPAAGHIMGEALDVNGGLYLD